jgi:hypothetical protein
MNMFCVQLNDEWTGIYLGDVLFSELPADSSDNFINILKDTFNIEEIEYRNIYNDKGVELYVETEGGFPLRLETLKELLN